MCEMPTDRQQRRPRLSATTALSVLAVASRACGGAMSDALDVGGPILLTLPTDKSDGDGVEHLFCKACQL